MRFLVNLPLIGLIPKKNGHFPNLRRYIAVGHDSMAIKNLSSCLTGGRSNYLVRNTKRGNAHAFLCKVPSYLKFTTFPVMTALQLCKLISVQGWIERLERNRRPHHSHQFLNYVLSFLEESLHLSQKSSTYYTPSHPQKQYGTEIQKPSKYTITDTIVVVAPTNVPYGKSLSRSFTLMPTAPAVAWKKLP